MASSSAVQGTWEKVDAPLLEAYRHNVVAARLARQTAEEQRHGSAIERNMASKNVASCWYPRQHRRRVALAMDAERAESPAPAVELIGWLWSAASAAAAT